jgi:hypothetical protein
MPTIEVTPEQYAYVQALRGELADEVTYGHVRMQDAVQYLVDRHRDADDELSVDPEAVDVDAVEPDGGAAVEGDAGDGTAAEGADADDGGPSVVGSAAALSGGGPGTAGDSGDSAADGDDGTTVVEGSAATLGDSGDENVSAMMNLLDDHADRWEETGSSDGKYAVELPDGDTEHVRTKDDVRALLFKHY